MPLIFSPVDLSELRDPFSPRPKSAFLMLQLGGTIAGSEIRMRQLVSDALTDRGIAALTTEVVSGTGDYLKKIVDLLRACGFGFAIFSDARQRGHWQIFSLRSVWPESSVNEFNCSWLERPRHLPILSGRNGFASMKLTKTSFSGN